MKFTDTAKSILTKIFIVIAASFTGIAFAYYFGFINATENSRIKYELTEIVNDYYKTWSDINMKRYSLFFMDKASVVMVKDGEAFVLSMDDFVNDQEDFLRKAIPSAKEKALSIEISGNELIASAKVRWRITQGANYFEGESIFVFAKNQENQWRIASLVYTPD